MPSPARTPTTSPTRHAGAALRFGRCEIRPATREIRLDGVPQPAAPKVFDLLMLLVERRDRVVPKAELLQAVWGRAVVSESVLARTVMKARRAIGDVGLGGEAMLRTVHRIGYRFIAPDETAGVAGGPSAPVRAEAGTTRRGNRLALLPLIDRSGDEAPGWRAQALSSQLQQSLHERPALPLLPPAALQAALDDLPPDAAVAERLRVVQRLRDAGRVVQPVLTRQGEALWLRADLVERDGRQRSVWLHGDEPRALARRLADLLADPDSARTGAAVPQVPAGFTDPFASEAYERGRALLEQREWALALPLLQVASDLQPEGLDSRLLQLRARVGLGDPACFVQAARLLAEARARDDHVALALVHESLAVAHRDRDDADADERAGFHLTEALRCLQGRRSEAWQARVHAALAAAMLRQGAAAAARRHLELADAALRLGGLPGDEVAALHGRLHRRAGQAGLAQQQLATAHAAAVARGARSAALEYLAGLAGVGAELGLLDVAEAQAHEAAEGLAGMTDAAAAAEIVDAASDVFAQAGAAAQIDRLLAALSPRGWPAPVRAAQAMARARAACLRGETESAIAEMQTALALAAQRRLLPASTAWQRELLWLLWADDRAAQAKLLMQQIAASHDADPDDLQQATLLHARALQALASGRVDEAVGALADAAQRAPAGCRVGALCRLDAAWLLARRGDAQQSTRLLRETGAWPQRHPVGRAAAAPAGPDDTRPIGAWALRRLPSLRPCVDRLRHSEITFKS